MSDDYARGQRDGLRLALLGESRSGRTNAIREVRHKTLQVSQKRVQTALNRLVPKDAAMSEEVSLAIRRLGL